MKKIIALLFIIPFFSFGQTSFHNNYDWVKTPDKYEVTESELLKDEIVVFEKRSVEYIHLNNNLSKFVLVHRITRLNTDKAIEENNKFYVSSDEDSKVIKLKARVIKPSGEMVVVSQKDIKQALDEDGNVKYNYFAFEGIEIGSFIEFLQYIEAYPELSGESMTLQNEKDKKIVQAELIYPAHLEFQIMPMNGLPTLDKDLSDTTRVRMHLEIKDLAGLEDEDWSAYNANLKKFYYKLSKNVAANKGNFYTYTEVAKLIHSDVFAPLTKKEKKLVLNFIEDNTKGAKTNLEKIRGIEDAMKMTIPTIDGQFENDDNIENILIKKISNEKGLTKLMLNCLREMGISFELVMTSNRLDELFLEEFQGYNFLQEYMIYVNELDMYYSSNLICRLGYPPYELTNNKGLFIAEVMLNDYATCVGKVKTIKGIDYKKSIDQIDTEVFFNDDLSGCKVNLVRTLTGYKAQSYQPIIDFLDDEQKTTMKEEFMKYLDESSTIENMSFENDKSNDFGNKPFIGKATITSPIFTEIAGDKILLKVGTLIGPQAQMYHKDARKSPVDSYYTRGYDRTIVINLPENYEVKNLSDLKITCTPDAKNNILGFTSNYEIKGNQIIVTVKEWYDTYYFSVEDYQMYEKTMNAAADFNKIVLVLQSK